MQTVLKELKEFINSEDCHIDQYAVSIVEAKINELIEKERTQIIEAFENGVNCGVENEFAFSDLYAQNYYTKNFKNK